MIFVILAGICFCFCRKKSNQNMCYPLNEVHRVARAETKQWNVTKFKFLLLACNVNGEKSDPVGNSLQQCRLENIVPSCQQHCSPLLHLIASWIRLINIVQHCWQPGTMLPQQHCCILISTTCYNGIIFSCEQWLLGGKMRMWVLISFTSDRSRSLL